MSETRDKEALAAFLARDAGLHLYELGDLDPFFFDRCRFHALGGADGYRAVMLEYACPLLPTVVALGRDDAISELFQQVLPSLPQRFYAHLSPGLEPLLGPRRREARGVHLKMTLQDRIAIEAEPVDGVEALSPADVVPLRALYARAYPDNWFDATMLETGRYFGMRQQGEIVAVAGVHVHAPRAPIKIAALGNVAVHPDYRGRGLARRVTARLCRELVREVDLVGLHVARDNAAAIACYQRLGFRSIATYEEWLVC